MIKRVFTTSMLILQPAFAGDKKFEVNGVKYTVPMDSKGYPKLINNDEILISFFMPGPGVGELKPLESHESQQFGWSSWSPIQMGNPLSELGHWCIGGNLKKTGQYKLIISHLFAPSISHQVELSAPCKFELRVFPISKYPQVWDWGTDNDSTWIPWNVSIESKDGLNKKYDYVQWIRLGHAEKRAFSIFISLENRKKTN